MASSQVLDIDALLAPIPGEHPAGEELRYLGTYDAIEEARREELPIEDDSPWRRPVKIANWPEVFDLATTTLATRSKDLQLAAWLTEALVKLHGFAGLRDGFLLLQGLLEDFWAELYPTMGDGELASRRAPFEWLNDVLPLYLKATAVTDAPGSVNYTFLDWEDSRRVDNLKLRNQEAFEAAIAEGKITGADFARAVAVTGPIFYEALYAELGQCREAYTRLDQTLDAKFGRAAAPSLQELKKTLEDCWTLLERLVPERLEENREAPDKGEEPRQDSNARLEHDRPRTPAASPADSLPLAPRDRADAYRRLEAVAAYFRRTEPQSPVPYAIELALRWGEMSLEEWLREVIKVGDVFNAVLERLGVQPNEENSGS
jgi:type VI secretion system protein ImpA